MSPSTNTRSIPTSSIETLDNVLLRPPNSPYLKKPGLDNTIKYIYNDIKAFHNNIHTDIKAMNRIIAATLATPIDTSYKKNKQE